MKRKIKRTKNKPLIIDKLFFLLLTICLLLQLLIMYYINDKDSCFLGIIFFFIITVMILFLNSTKHFENLYYFFKMHGRNNEKYKKIYYDLFPLGKYSAFTLRLQKYFKKHEITDKYVLNEVSKWKIKFSFTIYYFIIQIIWIIILYLLFKGNMDCF